MHARDGLRYDMIYVLCVEEILNRCTISIRAHASLEQLFHVVLFPDTYKILNLFRLTIV